MLDVLYWIQDMDTAFVHCLTRSSDMGLQCVLDTGTDFVSTVYSTDCKTYCERHTVSCLQAFLLDLLIVLCFLGELTWMLLNVARGLRQHVN